MVAVDDKNVDVVLVQTSELLASPASGRRVVPFPVEDVARDDDERDLFVNRKVDEILERRPGRFANLLRNFLVFFRQSLHGRIDMKVGRVNELNGHGLFQK